MKYSAEKITRFLISVYFSRLLTCKYDFSCGSDWGGRYCGCSGEQHFSNYFVFFWQNALVDVIIDLRSTDIFRKGSYGRLAGSAIVDV